MVNTTVTVIGVEDAMKALQAAFPEQPRVQRKVLNSTMSASAKKTMVPMAKALASSRDTSGALAESIQVRNASAATIRKRRAAGAVEMVPIRHHRKAMAMYIQHYYTAKGKSPSVWLIGNGLRYGHLVEFGSVNNSAYPFLWPAAEAQGEAYKREFASMMKVQIEKAVKREARKHAKAKKR